MFKVIFENDELDMIERIRDNLDVRFEVSSELFNLDGDHSRTFLIVHVATAELKREIEQFRDEERDFEFYLGPVSGYVPAVA